MAQCEVAEPQRIVLVFQGGGALGAYQAGVYEALHEHGVEPDWIIGTSIGAINGAIIASNRREDRLDKLREFWRRIELRPVPQVPLWGPLAGFLGNWSAITHGIPGFFRPNPAAWLGGVHAPLGVGQAGYYLTDALRSTLADVTGFMPDKACGVRLSLGAVNVGNGDMHYFDSSREALSVEHVMASGALPPAFPAVRIGDDYWWDGGIVSNTPIEAIFDDQPLRDSLVFAVNLWQDNGSEPSSIWQAAGRQKDIQYSSRADHHIEDERKLQHLRKIIGELGTQLTDAQRADPEIKALLAQGECLTLHIVRLFAPALDGENHTKDIDFTAAGIEARWQAGYSDTRTMLDRQPWHQPCDRLQGVHVHTL